MVYYAVELARNCGTKFNTINTDYQSKCGYELNTGDIDINMYSEDNRIKKIYVFSNNKEVLYCDFTKGSIRYTYGDWTYQLERLFDDKVINYRLRIR